MFRRVNLKNLAILIVLSVSALKGQWQITDTPIFSLDNQTLTGSTTETSDYFAVHEFEGTVECTYCSTLAKSYPVALVTVTVGQNGGPCAIYDPVTTYYTGGTDTDYGFPYIYVEALTEDLEFPSGVQTYAEDACDGTVYSSGGGNFYCA